MTERVALSQIRIDDEGNLTIDASHEDAEISVEEYSRFKYGDGHVASHYGTLMAQQALNAYPDLLEEEDVYVTSSAYKVAPPASHALLRPFIRTARAIGRIHKTATRFRPLRIHRAHLTNGDYAAMTVEEREAVVARNGLSLEEGADIAKKSVIALDDIYVTGSHERSIEDVMQKHDARRTVYSYVIQAAGGHKDPKMEAVINGASVSHIGNIIDMARSELFIPNARLCKFILSQSVADIERFLHEVPDRVSSTVVRYAIGDELHQLSTYQESFDVLVREHVNGSAVSRNQV